MTRNYVNRKPETRENRPHDLPLFSPIAIVDTEHFRKNDRKACQSDTMTGKEKSEKNDGQPANIAAVVRIIDAAINRASEGLRVVEDFSRMVLEDTFLTRKLKNLRHDLADSCKSVDSLERLQSRDSELDVGRSIQTEAEYQREGLETIVRANMTRVQQATRTIEEYSKFQFPEMSKSVEQIRYRAYTIEKAVFGAAFNRQRFENAQLYVLVDACGESSGFENLKQLVLSLVSAGVDLIQLRDKDLNDRELIEAGQLIAELTRETSTQFVMNDRVDLCVATGADGVHLGQEELSVHEARMILRPNQFVGVSTHSIEQVRKAVMDGADYIGVGPVFESRTKSFDSHVGVELVAEMVKETTLPAFAIGGINLSNVVQILEAGCQRIAVSSAVCKVDEPARASEKLLGLLRSDVPN